MGYHYCMVETRPDPRRQVALNGIESHSAWITYSTLELVRYIEMLPVAPSYETVAQAEMDKAESILREAIEKVRMARRAYGRKTGEG